MRGQLEMTDVKTIEELKALTDDQLGALSRDEFWAAIAAKGAWQKCDKRLLAEATRRKMYAGDLGYKKIWD
jgi:hypothetical protein